MERLVSCKQTRPPRFERLASWDQKQKQKQKQRRERNSPLVYVHYGGVVLQCSAPVMIYRAVHLMFLAHERTSGQRCSNRSSWTEENK